MTESECIVCGGDDIGRTYASLLECRRCGFVFARRDMTEEDYAALYGEGYFKGEEYADYEADRPALQRNFGSFLQRMEPHLTHLGPRPSLLEIGCAYGFFLDKARERFDPALGIDIGQAGPTYAREELRLDARTADFATVDLHREFDVACMWDAVEHIAKLPDFLNKLSTTIADEGMLFLTTNDIDSWNARLRRERWRQIHPPTHLWYFSRRTMALLLARHGFDVVDVQYVGYHRSIGNMTHNILGGGLPSLRRAVDRAGLGRVTVPINLGDIFWLAARKRRP